MENALLHIDSNLGLGHSMGSQIVIHFIGLSVCTGDAGSIATAHVEILLGTRIECGERIFIFQFEF